MFKVMFTLFTVIMIALAISAIIGLTLYSIGVPSFVVSIVSFLIGFFLPATLYRWIMDVT